MTTKCLTNTKIALRIAQVSAQIGLRELLAALLPLKTQKKMREKASPRIILLWPGRRTRADRRPPIWPRPDLVRAGAGARRGEEAERFTRERSAQTHKFGPPSSRPPNPTTTLTL